MERLAAQLRMYFTDKMAVVRDEKASGTNGGSSSAATWNARDLNTEYDPDNLVTISSNQITLAEGSYFVLIATPVIAASASVTTGRARLYNVTAASVVAEGSNMRLFADTGGNYLVMTRVDANGTDAYRVDSYTSTARATIGLGQALTLGTSEVYTEMLIWQLREAA